jgi:cytochrome P450
VGEAFASQRPEVPAVARVLAEWLVFRDPPDHTRLRALLQKTFTPRHLEKSRPRIQEAIDALIDASLADGETDFVARFAFPLPALVIAMLLGAPAEDIEAIKRWSDQLASYLGGALDDEDNFTRARAGCRPRERSGRRFGPRQATTRVVRCARRPSSVRCRWPRSRATGHRSRRARFDRS